MSANKIIIFTHIQKAAGTTLGRLLKAKYGFWPPVNLVRLDLAMGLHHYHYQGAFPKERILALQKLDEDEKRKICLVQGHMGFGIHEYFPQPCQYITAIREPVNRVFSQYHQMRQQNWCPYKHEIRSMPIEAFIEKYPIDALTNYQVKMLAGINRGLAGDTTPYDCSPSDPSILRKALQNIANHYLVVVTELFDESLLLLKKKLSWNNVQYIKSNVTIDRKRSADYGPSVIDVIRKHNELDIELYKQIVQQMHSEIESLGDPFQHELRTFRKRNEWLNRLFRWPIDRLLKFGRKIHVSFHRRGIASATKTK